MLMKIKTRNYSDVTVSLGMMQNALGHSLTFTLCVMPYTLSTNDIRISLVERVLLPPSVPFSSS